MSRFKIVKKHGRLEKRAVRRHTPWVDWKEKIITAVVGRPLNWITDHEDKLEKAMGDDEYVIWCLLLMFDDMRRHDSIIEFFMFQHEGRGVRLHMYAGNRFGITMRQASIYAAHRRLAEWMSLGWEKLVGWKCSIDTEMSAGWDPPIILRISIYPPRGSNFYQICKEMWAELGPSAAPSSLKLQESMYKRFR